VAPPPLQQALIESDWHAHLAAEQAQQEAQAATAEAAERAAQEAQAAADAAAAEAAEAAARAEQLQRVRIFVVVQNCCRIRATPFVASDQNLMSTHCCTADVPARHHSRYPHIVITLTALLAVQAPCCFMSESQSSRGLRAGCALLCCDILCTAEAQDT
jgi:hypothetical protein